jgi:nitroimidazol reductase NimA-like FMN-containing flavoprotein (pyridoxamine 5'-phosphate oxidase superfamily)
LDEAATQILGSHRTMAISTLRPDGWPQTTIVGYANEGFVLYFLIFRRSQKFANISADDRVSVAVGYEPRDLREAQAVYAAAFAAEVVNPDEQKHAWRLLVARHPNLAGAAIPDATETAFMRAECRHLSVLDYSKGLGHADALHLGIEDWISAVSHPSDQN